MSKSIKTTLPNLYLDRLAMLKDVLFESMGTYLLRACGHACRKWPANNAFRCCRCGKNRSPCQVCG